MVRPDYRFAIRPAMSRDAPWSGRVSPTIGWGDIRARIDIRSPTSSRARPSLPLQRRQHYGRGEGNYILVWQVFPAASTARSGSVIATRLPIDCDLGVVGLHEAILSLRDPALRCNCFLALGSGVVEGAAGPVGFLAPFRFALRLRRASAPANLASYTSLLRCIRR